MMEKLGLAITLADGQTLHAEPRPEDERQLAQLIGDRSTIEFATSKDDVEGHALSSEVLVDVEGHALVLRLPHADDAARLRRALAVSAVTATIVGAGVIAGLQPSVQTPATVVQVPDRVQVQAVPGPALRAQRDEMQREQSIQNMTVDAANPAIPAQALRAQRDEMQREQGIQTAPLDAANPAIPAQALRAQAAETQREQSLETVPLDADNPAVPAQALRVDPTK